jgi:hypothetical protein
MPFREPTDDSFVHLFFGWNRIEARSRHDDFSLGLAARTADPLWALGRQWQFLELRGEDGGTPIHVELNYEEATPSRLKLGRGPFGEIGTIPVEVVVEREAVDWDWRMRVRAGQQFERLVRLDPTMSVAAASSLIDSVRTACPIVKPAPETTDWAELDYTSRRFVSLMEGRAIDGEALLSRIRSGTPPAGIPSEVQQRFSQWYDRLYSQAPDRASPAWDPEQLDYDFRVQPVDESLPGPIHASSYRTGTVDWDTFTLERPSTCGFEQRARLQLTPVHVTFAGQPMRRWWEFEDRAVDLSALDTATTDLGKLALMEFALVFGDDWFVVPLTVRTNTLVRVRSLRVRDCFGHMTDIPPTRDTVGDPLKNWEVFALAPESRTDPTADFLFVPPISGAREESPILEEVRFARDEDANAVFAIEHTVPNWLGEPMSGFAAHLERLRRLREARAEPGTEATLEPEDAGDGGAATAEPGLSPPTIEYVLATDVPANWIPFIATDARNLVAGIPQRSVKLQRAAMVSTEAVDPRRQILGLSRLLHPTHDDPVEWINEEAVGREGVRIELRRQRMRSVTGETYVWLGRKIAVGKGETRSGLRFDVVKARP